MEGRLTSDHDLQLLVPRLADPLLPLTLPGEELDELDGTNELVENVEPLVSSGEEDLLDGVRASAEEVVGRHGEEEDEEPSEGGRSKERVEKGDADNNLERATVDHVQGGDTGKI